MNSFPYYFLLLLFMFSACKTKQAVINIKPIINSKSANEKLDSAIINAIEYLQKNPPFFYTNKYDNIRVELVSKKYNLNIPINNSGLDKQTYYMLYSLYFRNIATVEIPKELKNISTEEFVAKLGNNWESYIPVGTLCKENFIDKTICNRMEDLSDNSYKKQIEYLFVLKNIKLKNCETKDSEIDSTLLTISELVSLFAKKTDASIARKMINEKTEKYKGLAALRYQDNNELNNPELITNILNLQNKDGGWDDVIDRSDPKGFTSNPNTSFYMLWILLQEKYDK